MLISMFPRMVMYVMIALIVRLGILMVIWVAPQYSAWAETATIIVRNMPIREAAVLAKSRLSPTGRVIRLPSRKALIIEDDPTHIRQARTMVKRLDLLEAPLSIRVDTETYIHGSENSSHTPHVMLPGGWERMQQSSIHDQGIHVRHFNLRLSPGKYGRMEIGEIRAIRPGVRRWLMHYGIADTPDMALVPVRAGLGIQAIRIDDKHVRLYIRPWIEHTSRRTGVRVEIGILPGLGTTRAVKQPPGTQAPVWASVTPATKPETVHIEITGAKTELLVKLKKIVVLTAIANGAAAFSQALLSPQLVSGKPELRLSVEVSRSP